MPPAKLTYGRGKRNPSQKLGLTLLQKYELCCLRQKYPKLKLSKFAELEECPRRPDGRFIALQSLSDHLKNWEKIVADGPPTGPSANKQNNRASVYPILEHLLAIWIDAAEEASVSVTDEIIYAQSKTIIQQLTDRGIEEGYEAFDFSSGWLWRFKARFQIGRLTRHGHSGDVNESELPHDRESLAQQLLPFSSQDIYNADESGLVFNKQPNSSNVRLGPNKRLRGGKDQKTRITTFHIVNQDGSDKRKLWVIGRAQTPKVFRENKVNTANLPIIYRFNKRAWMLSGLWYEFLRSLNDEMRINRRHIALISDNCPSHPRPEQPPIDYTGPTPPTLTNITLIYLPPNKTAYLQPLDMGIIKSFKAAYRRLYAEYMVERFNQFGETPEKIDILKAIYLISNAWDSISPSTIQNCWAKANITTTSLPLQGPSLVDTFVSEQRSACLRAFHELRELGETEYQNFDEYFEGFFTDDNHPPLQSTLPTPLPDSSTLIENEITNGLLERPSSELNGTLLTLSSIEEDSDHQPSRQQSSTTSPPPVISTPLAIKYIIELQRYYQALPVTHLPNPDSKAPKLVVSKLVRQAEKIQKCLARYQTSQQTKQATLTQYFRPTFRGPITRSQTISPYRRPPGHRQQPAETNTDTTFPSPSRNRQHSATRINWNPEPRYVVDSAGSEDDWEEDEEGNGKERDEHLSCVPTRWNTGGINRAFQQL